jgi:signal transduction histidine kinase/ActR/RegA family two-component response regulator
MKLRTQIFLFLFLFGLVPLLAAVILNVPLVFERIESLYHKAHLQNLRAGFGDLDQHLARRHEMVRLLAKFPEPGLLLEGADPQPDAATDAARRGYVEWINQVLFDQLDIIRIRFIDDAGQLDYLLERNNTTGRLEPVTDHNVRTDRELIEAGLKLSPGAVLTGPIVFSPEVDAAAPNKFMLLGLISPVITASVAEDEIASEHQGVVVVDLDMGGLATAYRGMYWAYNDGRYLGIPGSARTESTAFTDFPGLQDIFARDELGLWEYQGQQVLWIPLFMTEQSGPLWVGRSVDPSPIAKLRHTIEIRVVTVVLGLLIVVLVVARLIAVRTERLGNELTSGITRVMENNEAVRFPWKRPEELRVLGANLTRLAETSVEHSKALENYARELEESNRFKSEFLANVSHELRTPLNSILLLSRMLAADNSGAASNENRKQAGVIHSAGTDLKALIDNILDLSRIEARHMTLVREAVDLRKLLEHVRELLQPQFDEKGLGLAIEVAADTPATIQSDQDKLRQILVNFLSNAVKFTESGSVNIRMQSCSEQTSGRFSVCIRVTDTGIGIPAGKQAIIFEAFKQADGSTSRRFGGTGLGLTISRELAQLIGADISIESQPGKGSTFSLLLPAVMPDADSEAENGPATTAESRQSDPAELVLPVADYAGKRVLLVDDDVRNLLALTPLLESWNIDVMAAGDGNEALQTLETGGAFDLVLLDIMMPDMDGHEVTREIRNRPDLAGLPVVALTARATVEDRDQSLQAGADDCLVKPVDTGELKAVLDRYLASTEDKGVA